MKNILLLLFIIATTLYSRISFASIPGIIYDIGGKFGNPINQEIYNAFANHKNIHSIEILNSVQVSKAIYTYAYKGYNPIVIANMPNMASLKFRKIAKNFPKTRFVLLNQSISLPNVYSLIIDEKKFYFMMGALAALSSDTGIIGLIGAMENNLFRNNTYYYIKGAQYANPKIKILQNIIGSSYISFTDPVKGNEAALFQFNYGADIICNFSGKTGVGIIPATSDSNNYKNDLSKNADFFHKIPSLIDLVDKIIYKKFTDIKKNNWKPGSVLLNIDSKIFQKKLRKYFLDFPNYSIREKFLKIHKILYK